MEQDSIYQERMEAGSQSYVESLKAISFHNETNQSDKIYQQIISKFDEEGTNIPFIISSMSFDSEGDGIYTDVLNDLKEKSNHKFNFKNLKEINSFFDKDNKLIVQSTYGDEPIASEYYNDHTLTYMKTISFTLNGNPYEVSFKQYTDEINYNELIENLVNHALEKEGVKDRWLSLPSVDQTFSLLFTTEKFLTLLKNEGYIASESYYVERFF